MSLTLGMTGMDPATETALKAAFEEANGRLGRRWQLVAEGDAEHVMVDMDSMYGPMSWLRLHAAGKRVVGLTTAPRTQTDFRLGRPFDGAGFAALLTTIAADQGVALSAVAPAPPPTPPAAVPEAAPSASPLATPLDTPAASSATAASTSGVETIAASTQDDSSARDAEIEDVVVEIEPLPPAPPSGLTHAPAPTDALPDELPSAPPPPQTTTPEPEAPAWPWPQSNLIEWLAPGALSQRARYRRASGPSLLIDPPTRSYHGPSTLKPFAAYFEGMVRSEDFEPLDDVAWARESAGAGPAQPLARLQWLGGLMIGKGALLPGYDPAGRFRLTKWPQTEREYPRHFRIATAMMRAPATLEEIAAASGMPLGDVADFVNANLVTGFAEPVVDAPVEPAEPTKPGGLFGRLRGR